MTSTPVPPRSPHRGRRNKKPLLLAGAALVLIIAAVVLVLVLAGGNKTGDGTGRDQRTDSNSPTNITNSSGNGAGGPVR